MKIELVQLVQLGKSETSDWYADAVDPAELASVMVAMANAQGGTLLLGVVADEIVGVKDAEQSIDLLLQAALAIEPPLIISMPETLVMDDKKIVYVHIPAGMPHVYSVDGRYLRRESDRNVPLPPSELRRLMLRRGQISFEMEIPHNASHDDIDWEKAQSYTRSLRGLADTDTKKVLLQRGCLTKQGEKWLPTYAGILLFGKDPQRFLRSAEITAVRFAAESMTDTFIRQDMIGTLPDQIRRAETFLVDHLRKDVKLQHTMARAESFEYPLEAARELVVNAVAHRDYSIHGDGIRLFIFSDRMEVESPGGLPGPVTIDNIKDERFSRNPVIVQVLSDMGFIERLGYGVDRVIELMERQNLRAPEFQERSGGFRVVLHNQLVKKPPPLPAGLAEAEGEFYGIYEGVPVNQRQEVAINLLQRTKSTRITNSDLSNLFPGVHQETIRRDLVDLVNKNIIVKMGQKRGSYYMLKRDAESEDVEE